MIKWIAQVVWFALFALGIGYFSAAPSYHQIGPDQALVRLSISHAGEIIGDCHKRSNAELQKLAPNMRAAQDCPRERSPVTVEMELDGRILYHEVIPPTGLSRDGASTVYRRFALPAGKHQLAVRLNDSDKLPGFNFQRSEVVQLQPAQVLVIDFNRQQGGVIIK